MDTPSGKTLEKKTENPYLVSAVRPLFFRTAAPIVLMMIVNGMFNIIDALFLGRFVGADALSAVTLMFPIFILMIALSNLVAAGMSSIIARQLGAERFERANQTLMCAMVLAVLVAGVFIISFLIFGKALINQAANQDAALAAMGYQYIAILIFCTPISFVMDSQAAALRSEGRVGFMAMMAISITLLNIVFNYVFIKIMGLGVFGSALGTVVAQGLGLCLIIFYRLHKSTVLKLFSALPDNMLARWREMMVLGIAAALNFVGASIWTAAIIYMLQKTSGDMYVDTVAAYGVVMRLSTFIFLPLLGFNLATQSLVGNNIGAGLFERANQGLKIAIIVSLIYGFSLQMIAILNAKALGAMFVDDALVISETARILPIMFCTFFFAGPVMVISGYFLALGKAGLAMFFGLTRTFIFGIPLTLMIPLKMGEVGVWWATPIANTAMVITAVFVLAMVGKRTGARFGLFNTAQTYTPPKIES